MNSVQFNCMFRELKENPYDADLREVFADACCEMDLDSIGKYHRRVAGALRGPKCRPWSTELSLAILEYCGLQGVRICIVPNNQIPILHGRKPELCDIAPGDAGPFRSARWRSLPRLASERRPFIEVGIRWLIAIGMTY